MSGVQVEKELTNLHTGRSLTENWSVTQSYMLLFSALKSHRQTRMCAYTKGRICLQYQVGRGTAVAQWLRCCATNRSAGSHTKSFRSHYGPGVDPASKRNEYQEHFLGAEAAGA